MNDILTKLVPTAKFLPITKRLTFLEWIHRAQIMIRGKPYSFKGHEYLKQIVNDNHPDQTFEKAAQVAISTVALMKGLYVAEHLGKKALYFFQDDAAVSDFSNSRCLSMIEESPYLRERVRQINNVGLKKIGPGEVYFRGLYSRGKAKTVDGDFVIFDEVAEMNEANKQLARDRIMHSTLQWVYALSQPDIPGADIDAEFANTDQHYWHLICPACGYKDNVLELDFPANFIDVSKRKKVYFPETVTHYRGCSKCAAKLDMSKGIWVPHQPSKKRRGYHLSQLYSQIIPPGYPNYATAIMDEYYSSRGSQSRMSRFTISILGFPYGGGAARVHDELLNFCEDDYGWCETAVSSYMGVDQGDLLTIAICIRSGPYVKFVYFEETERWQRLDELMDQFGVQFCIIDAQPNKHSAKTFVNKYPGRAAIQYFGSKEFKEGEEVHEGEYKIKTVSVDRTESLDSFIDKMEKGLIKFPNRAKCNNSVQLGRLEDVRRHLKKLTVKYETNSRGTTVRVYASGGNIENHYGMACNSAVIAAHEFGSQAKPMVMPVFMKVARA